MKVMLINTVFNKGSTGMLVYDIHTHLQLRGIECVVCYGRGEKSKTPGVDKTCGELYAKINNLRSRITGLMYGGCYFSTCRLIKTIVNEKPDIVHLHCLNGYFVNIYRLITWLNNHSIPTVLTLHAEFMHTGNCGYALDCEKWKTGCGRCPRLKQETKSCWFDKTKKSWEKMKKAFSGFERCLIVTSVSQWLMQRAKTSPILIRQYHVTVFNGVNSEYFTYNYDTSTYRKKLNLENKKIVLHITSSFNREIKGGKYVMELADRLKNSNITFVLVGNTNHTTQMPQNIIDIGRIEDKKELAAIYSLADVTLLTSKKETFSMVCAESLCCGTPVVGFLAGAPEMISIPEFSSFVEYGNLDLLEEQLLNFLSKKFDKKIISEKAVKVYSTSVMVDKYISIYEELIERVKC
jgi:putative colanic acid biosynthesis glycosyltransferase